MKRKSIPTEQLVIMALMITLTVVLSKLLSINISILRIGFGFLPISILAILYGPLWAGIGYAIADVIGGFLFPTGDFFPGFTLSAFLTGLIFGFLLYKKEVTVLRSFLAAFLVCLLVNLLLNTYWLTFFIGKAYKLLLATRVAKELIAIPIMTALVIVIDRTVIKAFNARSKVSGS